MELIGGSGEGRGVITSLQNKAVKQIVSLREKKRRDAMGVFVLEGERFVAELPEDWPIEVLVMSEGFAAGRHFCSMEPTLVVSDRVFRAMSETEAPQGILAVCKRRPWRLNDISRASFVLLAERISDPGNLGTILRCADASGCDAVVISKGSVDLYNPKVLRATAGSVFHLPVVTEADLADAIPFLQEQGVKIFAAHLKAKDFPQQMNFRVPCGILIGNEANGLTDGAADLADGFVKIPMPGRAESLNASVAAGILLYEVVRQRII